MKKNKNKKQTCPTENLCTVRSHVSKGQQKIVSKKSDGEKMRNLYLTHDRRPKAKSGSKKGGGDLARDRPKAKSAQKKGG